MSVYRNKGDAIEGEVISCQARKYEKIVLKGSGAHRAVRLKLSGRGRIYAYCVIDKPLRWIRSLFFPISGQAVFPDFSCP
jgi:hypothetical protein